MKKALVGFTGFVGSNLSYQYNFDDLYNSKNYKLMKNKEYDFLVCAGIPSSMWMANNNPEKDYKNIKNLLNVLISMKIKRIVLISTSAVYKQPPDGYNEKNNNFEKERAYGKNRRYAEEVVINNFKNYNIIRLPALFGKNLKKNFIYDLLNREPSFIPPQKFISILSKVCKKDKELLNKFYIYNNRKKIYQYDKQSAKKSKNRDKVLNILKKINFTSLNFTNSESTFQFYNIQNLKNDIDTAIDNDIDILNICSEPVKAKEVAKRFFSFDYYNDNGREPLINNIKTLYADIWNKNIDYQYSKRNVFNDLGKFFKKMRSL